VRLHRVFELAARAQSRPFRDELAELSDQGDAKPSHFTRGVPQLFWPIFGPKTGLKRTEKSTEALFIDTLLKKDHFAACEIVVAAHDFDFVVFDAFAEDWSFFKIIHHISDIGFHGFFIRKIGLVF
jgi:hypothetical protein